MTESIRPWLNTALLAVIAALLAIQVIGYKAPAETTTVLCPGDGPLNMLGPRCVPVVIETGGQGYVNPFDQ